MNWTVTQRTIFPLTIAIIILISAVLSYLLKGKKEKIRIIPLQIISALLIGAEIVKILNIYYTNGYVGTWTIPLHFCSTFMVWFFLASFCNGKVGQAGRAISFVTIILFFVGFMIGPSTIIGNATDNLAFTWSNFGNLHTFYYHWLVVLFGVLMISLKLYTPKFSDWKKVLVPFYIYAFVATVMANLLDTNYASLLTNVVGFIENIRLVYGYGLYLVFMYSFAGVCILGILFVSDVIVSLIKVKSRDAEVYTQIINK